MSEIKIHIYKILSAAWRQRYIIVIPILVFPIITGIISYISPKQYQSHTSMLIQESAKMNPFLEDIAVSTSFKERINGLRTLLRSRHILLSVAREQNMINDTMSAQEQDQVVQYLSARLSVKQLSNEFVQLTFTSEKRDEIKSILESVSRHFIEQLLAPEQSSIKDSSEFLKIHIEKKYNDLKETEKALIEFQSSNPDINPDIHKENLTRITSLKQQLSEKEALIAGMKQSLGTIDQQLSGSNPVILSLEEKIIKAKSDLALFQSKYTDSHSLVKNKKNEIKQLEHDHSQLIQSGQAEISSDKLWDLIKNSELSDDNKTPSLLITQLKKLQQIRSDYESLSAETESIKSTIKEITLKTVNYSDKARKLEQLTRNVNSNRNLYDQLTERYEMAKLTGSLGIFEQNKRVKIIDLPFTPGGPINWPFALYVVLGVISGLLLGSGVAVLIELFDSSIRYQDELETLTKLPVLTTYQKYDEDQID